ncbi:MAG: hypothetical protein EBS05_27250, partial [Proteobacteria bacterium]|nr:hypothetical protein [Pseudomonadota bacterium]
ISLPENVFPEIYDEYYDLTLPGLQPADSGAYSFVVSNTVGGMATSGVFNVTIQSTSAPVVLQPPTNVNVFLYTGGTIINERVTYSSFYPVTVQWLSNNIVLSGQTLSNLTLGFTSLQDFNLSVALSNQVGVTTSAVARISITYGPGTRDTNFVSTNTISGSVTTLAALPNGGVLAGGTFTAWGASNRNYLVEMATNGAVTPWLAHTNGLNGQVNKIQRLADGKILVGGNFNNLGTTLHYGGLLRLNADGSLDETFQAGSPNASRYIDHNVTTFAIRPSDGAIAVAGTFTNVAGQLQRALALLDSNGVFQTSFRPSLSNSVFQTYPFGLQTLAFQADGKLLVGGQFTKLMGVPQPFVGRLNTDGTLDNTFNVGGGPDAPVRALLVLPDGTVFIAGDFTTVNGVASPRLARLTTNGTVDATFATQLNGGLDGPVFDLALQGGNNIVVAGQFTKAGNLSHLNLARVGTNGTVDPTFTTSVNDYVNKVAVQPDGKVILGGGFTAVNGLARSRVARLNVGGSVDANINFGFGADADVEAVLVQPDDLRIVLGGQFQNFNGVPRAGLVRLNGRDSTD